MKRFNFLLSFPLLMLLAYASLGQSAIPSPTPPGQKSDPEKVCPTVSVSCPSAPDNWQLIEFSASISGGDPNAKPTYTWEVSKGVITEGQGTPTIKVSVAEPQTITATVRVGRFDAICATTGSCTLGIHLPAPAAEKFASYGIDATNNERDKLSLFSTTLVQRPGAQGYLLIYDSHRGLSGAKRAAGERAKAYLVKDQGIDAERIVIIEAGFKEKLTIDLWIVPTGATPPKPEPAVDPARINRISDRSEK